MPQQHYGARIRLILCREALPAESTRVVCSARDVLGGTCVGGLQDRARARDRRALVELPGVLAYGATQDEAVAHVQALALRVVADRLENDEAGHEFLNISFLAA